MPTITRFEDIKAWKTARQLTNLVYEFSGQGKFARDYGLRDQIRRASVSVMSNIAEGFESQTQALFVTFLGRAKASAGEVRSQLYIALDQEYINKSQFDKAFDLADKCSRQIYRFMEYLKSQPNSRRISEDRVEYNVQTF
jgi:four helix bundle protein